MTVRVAAAVLAALALVAAAAPAVEHARDRRDAARVDATLAETTDAVRALERQSDPGERLATAPRRTVDVSLPADATITAESDPPRLVARAGSGAETATRVPVEVRVCGDREQLRGDATLVYLAADDGPVVLALRGFIRGDGSKAAHACTPGSRPGDGRPRLRV